MIEPDEEEDPTRICEKCGIRPRWSRSLICKRCVECAGKAVAYCIRARKGEVPPGPSSDPRSPGHRERYARLKAAGANGAFARNYCRSKIGFERAMRQLQAGK